MVVVVIIGILVAIAIPVYSGVQDNARRRADDANVRILNGAVTMYVAETAGANVADFASATITNAAGVATPKRCSC